jgi:hypothetical protein
MLPAQPTACWCVCNSQRDFLREDDFRVVLLRAGDFRAVERVDAFFARDFETCSGFPLRLVEANSSSCLSVIDLYMLREAPLSLLGLVLPRLAESAAPAAFCCAADLAGMMDLFVTGYANDQRAFGLARSRDPRHSRNASGAER